MLCQPLCVLVGTILQCSMKKCAIFNSRSTNKESIGCSTNLQCMVKYISDRRCLVTKPAPSECSQDSDMKPTSQNNLKSDGPLHSINKATKETEAYESSYNKLGSASTHESKTKEDAFQNMPKLQDKAGFSPENALKQGAEMEDAFQNMPKLQDKAGFSPENALKQGAEMEDAFQNMPKLQDKAGSSPENALKQGDKSMDGYSQSTAIAVTKATENQEGSSVTSKKKKSSDLFSTLFDAASDATNIIISGVARSTNTTK